MSVEDGLAFGMLVSGRMVGVREVPNGINCGCVCPSCRAPLVARQGKIRTWHFSHAPGHETCSTGAETALHRMAKQIIAEWDVLDLPLHEVRVSRTVSGRNLVRTSILPACRFDVRTSKVEQPRAGITPDVLLEDHGAEMLAVEVCVTHPVEESKRVRVAELNLPMIEYDLSVLSRRDWDVASLEAVLRPMAPAWILHPLERSVRGKLEGELLQDEADLLREIESRMVKTVVDAGSPPVSPRCTDSTDRARELPKTWTPRVLGFEWYGVPIVINVWTTAAVWVCTSDLRKQALMLAHLEADAAGCGLYCDDVIRTRGHGVLIASGMGSNGWAETLEDRLAGVVPTDLQPEEYIDE